MKTLKSTFTVLCFSDIHINEVNKKATCILIYISRIGENLDKQTRVIDAQTLVVSLTECYIRIWGTTSDMVSSSVQKLHSFAARLEVREVKKYDHISPSFKELKWLRLKQNMYLT